MSKIEIDLKDDFTIKEDGHAYQVPTYKVVEGKGLEIDYNLLNIRFVRGSKLGEDNIEPKSGTLHEHLLGMMIHDLKFKNNIVPSRETSLVITKLEEALMWTRQRQIERIKRDVVETYKK